ncbi:MAG TPA: hypothetical protein VKV25_09330 [Acidimicrobiales bacterium]|nr:hypothetical protein [Acidimicrobiales bacterium]
MPLFGRRRRELPQPRPGQPSENGASADKPAGSRSWRRPVGVAAQGLDRRELERRLAELGEAGQRAEALDQAVEATLGDLLSLSTLTSALAVEYLERIKHALKALRLEDGVYVTTRAYAAHLAVEADPAAYGATDVPVLGTLPAARNGQAPRDLLNRIVRASRRGFDHLRAVDGAVWEGFVDATTWRVHERRASGGEDAAYLDPLVVDGLVRFGWLLRQVDLHYGMEPERGGRA